MDSKFKSLLCAQAVPIFLTLSGCVSARRATESVVGCGEETSVWVQLNNGDSADFVPVKRADYDNLNDAIETNDRRVMKLFSDACLRLGEKASRVSEPHVRIRGMKSKMDVWFSEDHEMEALGRSIEANPDDVTQFYFWVAEQKDKGK